jgi:hypothetical protein
VAETALELLHPSQSRQAARTLLVSRRYTLSVPFALPAAMTGAEMTSLPWARTCAGSTCSATRRGAKVGVDTWLQPEGQTQRLAWQPWFVGGPAQCRPCPARVLAQRGSACLCAGVCRCVQARAV